VWSKYNIVFIYYIANRISIILPINYYVIILFIIILYIILLIGLL
jgi:hypothetical protein